MLASTDASPSLVEYRDSEILTTRDKRVDTSKARDHLGHQDSVSLVEGVAKTVAWMKDAYRL